MAAISSGFSTREKDPTWLLCSNWSRSAPGPPSDPALQSRGSGQVLQQDPDPCVDPSPAEQRVHAPGHARGLQDPAALPSISTAIQAKKERIKALGLYCFGKEDYEAVSLPCVEEGITELRRAPRGRDKRPVRACCLQAVVGPVRKKTQE